MIATAEHSYNVNREYVKAYPVDRLGVNFCHFHHREECTPTGKYPMPRISLEMWRVWSANVETTEKRRSRDYESPFDVPT